MPRRGQTRRVAVRALVDDRARVLVVQATGWGKSAVYWAATRALRADGAGCTLVVSPLLALMRDQIAAAERTGLRAATVNSTNVDEWAGVMAELRRRDDRRAADLAGAAGEPTVRGAAASAARRLRAARDRRGALRVRLGVRLPTRLPAADPNAPGTDPRDARSGDDGDRQRTGHPRRGRPTRPGHHHAAGIARPRLAAAGRGPGARPRAAVRVGGRRPAASWPDRGSSTC